MSPVCMTITGLARRGNDWCWSRFHTLIPQWYKVWYGVVPDINGQRATFLLSLPGMSDKGRMVGGAK